MERINGRLAVALAATLVLVVVLVGWFALVSPQRSKAASLDGQIGDASVKLASTQAFMRSPEAHQSVELLAQVRRAVPNEVGMSEILRQLSSAAARSGVRIDSITPSAPVAAAGAQAVPIALSVSGHYFRLAKFMHLLRTRAAVKDGKLHVSGRLYAIDSISFSSGDKGGLITAALALDAFTYGAAQAPSSTTAGQTTTPTP